MNADLSIINDDIDRMFCLPFGNDGIIASPFQKRTPEASCFSVSIASGQRRFGSYTVPTRTTNWFPCERTGGKNELVFRSQWISSCRYFFEQIIGNEPSSPVIRSVPLF